MFEGLFAWKASLPCPGPYESLHRESKSTLASLSMFDGAKLDATAVLSPNFHASHALQWGSAASPPVYHFGIGYQLANSMLSGQLDSQYNLQARAHHVWHAESPVQENAQVPATDLLTSAAPAQPAMSILPRPSIKTKIDTSLPAVDGAQPMIAIEHEHVGKDWSLSLKAMNPNPLDTPSAKAGSKCGASVTGIYSLAYLQSVSRSIVLGGELMYQRPTPDISEPSYTLVAKWTPEPTALDPPTTLPAGMVSPFPAPPPQDPTQTLTVSTSPSSGMTQCTYWKRLNQRLEVSGELQALTTPGSSATGQPGRREAIASVGFRLQTVFSMVRGMIDTAGRVCGISEYTLAPGLVFSIAGEIDYGKVGSEAGKVGVGLGLEM